MHVLSEAGFEHREQLVVQLHRINLSCGRFHPAYPPEFRLPGAGFESASPPLR
jgi:hypothetical protein